MHGQVGVVLELMDYTSDAIVFSEVLSSGAEHSETESFVLPYIIAFSIASLVSAISLVMKVRLYVNQVRKRRADADPLWLEISATFSKRQQKVVMLNNKLLDTKKAASIRFVTFLRLKRACTGHYPRLGQCAPGMLRGHTNGAAPVHEPYTNACHDCNTRSSSRFSTLNDLEHRRLLVDLHCRQRPLLSSPC
jgi:hypothetical protein